MKAFVVPSLTEQRRKYILGIGFLLYALITLLLVFFHEVWFDESQAFVIARDLSPAGIVGIMKYEGHSALWHFILFPFAKLGGGVICMQITSWVFMVSAAWLLMFRSPFSTITKYILLFSSGFLYVNVTVARVYSLSILLLFCIAICYPKRNERPLLYGLLLGLLANTHITLCGLVGILGIYMLVDCIQLWKSSARKQNGYRVVGMAVALFLIFLLVAQIAGSLSMNNHTAANDNRPVDILKRSVGATSSWISSLASISNASIFDMILFLVLLILFLAFLILLGKQMWKKKRRFLLILVVNYIGFCIINGGIFNYNAHRATLLLISFFVLAWMAEITQKNQWAIILLSVFTAFTIPIGIRLAITDYTGTFCASKETAAYITNNLPKNAVIVTHSDEIASEISCYEPNIKIWDAQTKKIVSFCSHKTTEDILKGKPFNFDESVRNTFHHSDLVYVLMEYSENKMKFPYNIVFKSKIGKNTPDFAPKNTGYIIYQYDFSSPANYKATQ